MNALPENSPAPWSNAACSIKRNGLTITNCDSEPVQPPKADVTFRGEV